MDQSSDRTALTQSHAPDVYDGDKPLNEIEEDIARTRVRLSAAMEALEYELAPDRVVQKGSDLLRSALEPAPGSFRQQARAYAIPLALIAAGLGWLIMLRRRSYQPEMPSSAGELPAEATEVGVVPVPAPSYADFGGPIEPVSVTDETSSI